MDTTQREQASHVIAPAAALALAPAPTHELVESWAERVDALWDLALEPVAGESVDRKDLYRDACAVRDQISNLLASRCPSVSIIAEHAAELLGYTDNLFRLLTVEADSPSALASLAHYGRASQWWWKRLPREISTAATVAVPVAA